MPRTARKKGSPGARSFSYSSLYLEVGESHRNINAILCVFSHDEFRKYVQRDSDVRAASVLPHRGSAEGGNSITGL